MGGDGALGTKALAAAAIAACGCLEFTPHALPDDSERGGNAKALARVASAGEGPRGAVVALLGDIGLATDDASDAVAAINARGDVDLVVQLGDLTELATLEEFRRGRKVLGRLHAPYLVLVGNHDLLGNGERIFEAMFGPLDVAFTFARTRFVLLDSNSRERGMDGTVPDLAWLAAAIAPSPRHDRTVLLSHVPPTDPDFDPRLAPGYLELARAAGPVVSVHGHLHRAERSEPLGVPVFVADQVSGRSYLLLRLPDGGGLSVEEVRF